MKKMKKFVVALLVLATVLSLAACGAKKEETPAPDQQTAEPAPAPAVKTKIDEIKEAGVLVLGTSADYPPYEFHMDINGKDTIVGFDIAMAQYIADALDVELKVVDMNFDSLLISLAKGDFDIVLAGVTPTPERAKSVDFSDVIYKNNQVALIRKADADTLVNQASLAGHKGAVQSGSQQANWAGEVLGGEQNMVALTKFNEMILELKNGKVDAAFTNSMTALPWLAANDDLTLIQMDKEDPGFACAIQQGNPEFVEFVNEQFAAMKAAGLVEQYIMEAQELAGVSE